MATVLNDAALDVTPPTNQLALVFPSSVYLRINVAGTDYHTFPIAQAGYLSLKSRNLA